MADMNQHAKIITIANDINKIFADLNLNDRISMHRIIVIGTQSAGKSSLLNQIMKLPILPIGKKMVTKTPVHIDMKRSLGGHLVEIGYYSSNKWIQVHRTTFDELTREQTDRIRDTIQVLSDKLTDGKAIVVDNPIHIRVTSPVVPNLSLIDLPGLVTIACADKGQPETIVQDIETLVTKYIKQPKTIVLTVVQAKTDLETDLGLALVKRVVSECKDVNTVGVLTKPDLLDAETNLGNFVSGPIDHSLAMDYGYYIVNCKENENENAYFASHNIYSKQEYRSRCCVNNLSSGIADILIKNIKVTIPQISSEIYKLEQETLQKIQDINNSYPADEAKKINLIAAGLRDLTEKLNNCIESRGIEPNIGKFLGTTFNSFRKDIDNQDVFSDKIIPDSVIKQIYQNFQGYHIKTKINVIDILEAVIKHEIKPISALKKVCNQYIDIVSYDLLKGIRELLKQGLFKYDKLNSKLIELIDSYLKKIKEQVKQTIDQIITAEESFILTDDEEFLEQLNTFDVSNKEKHDFDIFQTQVSTNSYENKIRRLLQIYLKSIKKNLKVQIPKILMSMIVINLKQNIHSYLTVELLTKDSANLIEQSPQIKQKMELNNKIMASIKSAKDILVNL